VGEEINSKYFSQEGKRDGDGGCDCKGGATVLKVGGGTSAGEIFF